MATATETKDQEAPASETQAAPKARSPRKATGAAKKASGNGKKRGPKSMSDDHKAKLAEGRVHSKIVRDYLLALDEHKPRRGRKVTKESLQAKLAEIDTKLNDAKPIERLRLVQQRMDTEAAIESFSEEFDITELEAAFVKIAKEYADRTKITRKAFVTIGVPAEVLKKAGV